MPTPTILEPQAPVLDTGAPPPPGRKVPGGGEGGGGAGSNGGRGSAEHDERSAHVAVTGMWVALAPILMLFLAFTSAYIVRQGLGQDWTQVAMPRLLWGNTLLLLLSSVVFERGRRALRANAPARPWILMTLGLGIAFVVGQLLAWRELGAQGIGIGATPYSSFFYLLTGAHAVHLAGGIVALVASAVWPTNGWHGTPHALVLKLVAIYWHFMGVLWLGLFALLNFWR